MRLHNMHHLPLATYLSTLLIIATGVLFGLLCLLMFLLESLIKLLTIPIVLLFGMACLTYGLAKRKLYHRLKQPYEHK